MHALATKQGKACKGDCSFFASGKPIGPAYITHNYCSSCVVWMLKKYIKKFRCPCCNRRVRTKSTKSKAQLTKRYIITKSALGMFKKFVIYGRVELR